MLGNRFDARHGLVTFTWVQSKSGTLLSPNSRYQLIFRSDGGLQLRYDQPRAVQDWWAPEIRSLEVKEDDGLSPLRPLKYILHLKDNRYSFAFGLWSSVARTVELLRRIEWTHDHLSATGSLPRGLTRAISDRDRLDRELRTLHGLRNQGVLTDEQHAEAVRRVTDRWTGE